jgi:radical SAM superfamily enzyme
LADTLIILRNLRKKLLNDFVEKNPEIYIPSFKYENKYTQLDLSINKYIISWVNQHISSYVVYLKELNVAYDEIGIIINEFITSAYRNILIGITQNTKLDSVSNTMLKEVANGQLKSLEQILELGDLTDQNFNTILIEYEKDKALFDRKIKELKEK